VIASSNCEGTCVRERDQEMNRFVCKCDAEDTGNTQAERMQRGWRMGKWKSDCKHLGFNLKMKPKMKPRNSEL